MNCKRESGKINIGPILVFLCFLALGGYSKYGESDNNLPADAPAGALEFFESEDRQFQVVLYKDRVHVKSPNIISIGGKTKEMDVMIKDIGVVRRNAFKIHILGNDKSEIHFDLGIFGRDSAERFKNKVEELMAQVK